MRVTHHLVDKNISIAEFYCESFTAEKDRFDHLLTLGAIYLNKKRISENRPLKSGDYLRIHHRPRRFSTNFNWGKTIVFENDEFVVIDKPPGLPVHPTLDNNIENVLCQLSRHLKIQLFLCHRLDINTSGLLLFAKTVRIQKKLNRLFEKAEIMKIYQAKTLGKTNWPHLSGNVLEGYMVQSKNCPKKIESTPGEGKKICRLKVLDIRRCQPTNTPTPLESIFHSLKVQLLTGRTHQIRAQLAQAGHPILGDQLYGCAVDHRGQISHEPLGLQNTEPIALKCTELAFEEHHFRCAPLD